MLFVYIDGGVLNMIVKVLIMDVYLLGYVMYFFEIVVGILGYLNGVNLFD